MNTTKMERIEINLPQDIIFAMRGLEKPEWVKKKLRIALAILLFQEGTISLGKATELTGMSRVKLIFDTNALITSCKFYVSGLPVIKYIAKRCEIIIAHSVNEEVVSAGGRYPNAVVAKELMFYISYANHQSPITKEDVGLQGLTPLVVPI